MIKKDNKSFEVYFKGEVKRLQLTIQDVPIYKSPKDKETLVGNKPTIFGTLQLFKKGDKKKVKNVNFTLPFSNNKDFQSQILAMIEEALSLYHKKNG